MIALRLLFALLLAAMLPCAAFAQDDSQDTTTGDTQSGDADQAQPPQDDASAAAPADPVEALQGLWHVDRAEGNAASEAMTGGILKIDRQAVASLSSGTCASPGFAPAPSGADPKQVGVDITCLGQILASARWSTDDLDTVNWSEPNLQVVLHRVKSATAAQKPAEGSGTDGDAQ